MTSTVVSNRKRDLEVAAQAAELLFHGVNLASGCQKVVHLPLERHEARALACATVVTPDVARHLVSARAMALSLATRFELEGLKSALRRRRLARQWPPHRRRLPESWRGRNDRAKEALATRSRGTHA